MFSFFFTFIFSAVLTLLIVRMARRHKTAMDSDLSGVQKVHTRPVPRIGGLAIFLSVVVSGAIVAARLPQFAPIVWGLLLCSAFAFGGGIVEDFTRRVSPKWRLLLAMVAALLGFFLVDARIVHIDLVSFDWKIDFIWLALPLTVLAVACIVNAINLIDGFNGLASVVTIFMLLSLAYVALQVNDSFVLTMSLIVAGGAAGFLVWNYPAGMIFLGDGGAYFLGFMLAELAVMLVARNPQVSAWYAALLLIYPGFETVFSVYRRVFLRGRSPGLPDGIHLHSLIFRRLVQWAIGGRDARALTKRNSLTSPYLWLLSLLAVIPATLFWRQAPLLILFCVLFVVVYVWLYGRIVQFRSPRWLVLNQRKKRSAKNLPHRQPAHPRRPPSPRPPVEDEMPPSATKQPRV
ncbi:UDP-N-acetylmuramyl pentapeptide phosphotransferase/UDP-N-acetylglucosamine-1-phosphate transferase [Noviherbaspirillum humi]|uniref:UDP-N-acetylmuramyl pentapeptide phosphotransferase/UDP-N-acetylglucosamine-1-phosphate transferase n=1 Tax=Noviherbaspirillum humi TaxID=1688639 RepID=A0A239CUG9_9BURK|nr:glycosyltransferase [Noviherbaspirillum humi]SNS23886.1 UDP-N-acetylmuramyl pentapeptide phosphotransferase/UDP-N-acetylglucosamine-1-phosphate transferase [Noviherbaspirillum humi]